MNESHLAQFKEVTARIATEIVLAEDGRDNGLLPVNSLLLQLEECPGLPAAPDPLRTAVQSARLWVDGVLDGPGVFTAPMLQRLGEWAEWMNLALALIAQHAPPPAIPAHWAGAPAAPSAPPSAPLSGIIPMPPAEEPALLIDRQADAELLREFINESNEHLQNIDEGVLVLEENPGDADTLNTIFRAFHTFKGGAGFLQLAAVQTLAHDLEELLDHIRQEKLQATPAVIALILEGSDCLKQFLVEIDARVAGRKDGPVVVPTLHLLARIRATLREDSAPATVPLPAAPRPADAGPRARTGGAASAVKVDTTKLDSVVDLVGELVISQLLVLRNPALADRQDEQLSRDIAQLARITKDLQRTAMSLRMMPVRPTFRKMNRLVHDTAARLGKQVRFITEGEETELDRTIVELVSDPLIHMVRNAVDHGIEPPAVRQQCGKDPQGTVRLRAFHQGGAIVIEIQDDGAGLDKERILARAIERGMISSGGSPTEGEILNCIFAPGFTLAEKVTDVSGRGVGMDVVRRNVEKLRGTVEIQSVPGHGSTFRIHLPLTLAIIEGMIVGVGQQRYILPALSICESFRPAPGAITSVQGRDELINVRGRLRPVLRLYEHFGITPASTDPARSIAVVIEAGRDTRCLIVDELLGKQEVVIKSLGETFKQCPGLAGAAILGDGRVGLILDPQALVDLGGGRAARAA
jgi:two-component system chemotaxis sensor kinase CheA